MVQNGFVRRQEERMKRKKNEKNEKKKKRKKKEQGHFWILAHEKGDGWGVPGLAGSVESDAFRPGEMTTLAGVGSVCRPRVCGGFPRCS